MAILTWPIILYVSISLLFCLFKVFFRVAVKNREEICIFLMTYTLYFTIILHNRLKHVRFSHLYFRGTYWLWPLIMKLLHSEILHFWCASDHRMTHSCTIRRSDNIIAPDLHIHIKQSRGVSRVRRRRLWREKWDLDSLHATDMVSVWVYFHCDNYCSEFMKG